MMALSDLIDRYEEFQKPLTITALGAPSEPPTSDTSDDGELDPGFWRQPWSDAAQREWLTHAILVAMGKPAVRSVCWQALYDTSHEPEMRAGGLITPEGKSKSALARLAEIRRRLHNRRSLDDLLLTAHEPAIRS